MNVCQPFLVHVRWTSHNICLIQYAWTLEEGQGASDICFLCGRHLTSESLTRLAAEMVRASRLSRTTHAVVEPGNRVATWPASSAPCSRFWAEIRLECFALSLCFQDKVSMHEQQLLVTLLHVLRNPH